MRAIAAWGETPAKGGQYQVTALGTSAIEVKTQFTTCAVKSDGTLWCWGYNGNGQLDNGPLVGTVTGSQLNSTGNVLIGQRSNGGFNFIGSIDNVRMYGRALSAAELQTDMTTPLGSAGSTDPTPPTVAITAPAAGAQVNNIVVTIK